MDRRDFFKTIFATPLLAPILFSSDSSTKDELLLIADSPEIYLPVLLKGLGEQNVFFGRKYFLCHAHPREKALLHALSRAGLTQVFQLEKADWTLAFRPLQRPMAPSFTLVRAGKILDIRTKDLLSLWQGMNKSYALSSVLTIVSRQTNPLGTALGDSVRIYAGGRVVEEISLKKDLIKTFRAKQGEISLKIDQGKAFILSSSCRHKICCSVPPVSFSGERIVCAPNHFLLEVLGPSTIDTIIG
jgi:hypothetical protein